VMDMVALSEKRDAIAVVSTEPVSLHIINRSMDSCQSFDLYEYFPLIGTGEHPLSLCMPTRTHSMN
jgi:hypothetical protein